MTGIAFCRPRETPRERAGMFAGPLRESVKFWRVALECNGQDDKCPKYDECSQIKEDAQDIPFLESLDCSDCCENRDQPKNNHQ